ncbi:MAG TPA: undecaprenyldiphospho-muramoylpentapeptide beta-N-acetylglucosaminyltransferase [Phnomibacter sp.]|nr:undecaprenyldiphospho-muramoylpentapeptide beta-N-acetylglucosaminyltransferase [Phnomibacter sp.]
MNNRIVIAGGGTGGHIFPAVAVANALRRQDPSVDILFVGAKGKMEMEKVPKAGYRIEGLDIAGFDRGNWWRNVTLPLKILRSFWQVRSIFSSFRPHAAFGVGGYSSYPVLRYAQSIGLPTYLHEANAFAGKSNLMLAKRVRRVFTGTRDMQKFFPAEKIMFTGNPVRREVIEHRQTREDALATFGLSARPVTLLVIGGSLGARSINQAVRQGLNRWVEAGYQLIWQTGKLFIDEAKRVSDGIKGVYVSEFINDMNSAYTAADLVVSRAGAMSVTELCLSGKPVIFVPFPYAAEDHQTANAMALVLQDAAWMVKDDKAAAELMDKAHQLAADDRIREEMSRNIRPLAAHDADIMIAREILNDLNTI